MGNLRYCAAIFRESNKNKINLHSYTYFKSVFQLRKCTAIYSTDLCDWIWWRSNDFVRVSSCFVLVSSQLNVLDWKKALHFRRRSKRSILRLMHLKRFKRNLHTFHLDKQSFVLVQKANIWFVLIGDENQEWFLFKIIQLCVVGKIGKQSFIIFVCLELGLFNISMESFIHFLLLYLHLSFLKFSQINK